MGFSLSQWVSFAKPVLVGLDIGSSSVKVLRLHREGGEYVVTAAACTAIDSDQDPQINRENTIRAIRSCLQTAGCPAGTYVVCGVEGADVAVRGFHFPPLPEQAVEQAIRLEAQQVCALDIAQSAVDYQELASEPLNERPKEKAFERNGYLVVGTSDIVSRKTDMADKASARTVLMDVNGLAVLNCLCQNQESQSCDSFAVLDVGYNLTNLSILGSDGVPFVRDLPYAANHIYSQIASGRQITPEKARQLIVKEGNNPASSLREDLEQACGKLIADVNETLRYYTMQENTGQIQRIWLCGGFALVGEFVKILEKSLPVPVQVFNPFEKMRIQTGPAAQILLKTNGPAMATVAGLAMRSID